MSVLLQTPQIDEFGFVGPMTHQNNSEPSSIAVELSPIYAERLYCGEIKPEGNSAFSKYEYPEPSFDYTENALEPNRWTLNVSIEQDLATDSRTLFRVYANWMLTDEHENPVILTDAEIAQIVFLLQKTLHRSHWKIVEDQLGTTEHGWSGGYLNDNPELNLIDQVINGNQYDWWLDERPFCERKNIQFGMATNIDSERFQTLKRFSLVQLEKFQTFERFSHWNDMMISLEYYSGVDGSRGKPVTGELLLFETYENYSEVSIQLVEPVQYIQRLKRQFEENFELDD